MDNNGKHYIFHRIIITVSFSSKYHISNFSKKFPSSILFLYPSLCLFFYRKFFGQNRKVYLSSNYFLRFLLLFLFFFSNDLSSLRFLHSFHLSWIVYLSSNYFFSLLFSFSKRNREFSKKLARKIRLYFFQSPVSLIRSDKQKIYRQLDIEDRFVTRLVTRQFHSVRITKPETGEPS